MSSFLSNRKVSQPPLDRVSAAQAPEGPPPMTATRRGRSRVAPSLCHNKCGSRVGRVGQWRQSRKRVGGGGPGGVGVREGPPPLCPCAFCMWV